ncbi:hypothetical protein [Streptomyces sp. NBC_00878]|uniref:hypothetical protein n=1 Tax=Streptomyces sp. NBC_00878 TaxID=2975854 RepID=UPI00225B2E6F|nr:hypothetical protein [Streptomyces sp. NBC_00878]MCX4911889.1 hypothetical protein [Streptomyces sp. NBC_00878]
MAITTLSTAPYGPASDMVSLQEASELFRDTGHEASVKVLRRRAVRAGKPVKRVGRADYASWSDLLEVHAAMVDEKAGP